MSNFGGGIFLGCFGFFWCSFVFFIDGLLAWNAVQQVRASSFPTTTGTVTEAQLVVDRDSEGTSYSPKVHYRYEVDGKPFESGRIRYDSMSFGQAHSQAVVDRYPPGRAVTVHYHPAAPDRAVLEVGLDTAGLLGLLFLTPFNAVAFLFAGGALGWICSRQLGRPVLGISVRDDGLGQTIRIYDVSPVMVALAVWGGVGFLSIFGYLLLTNVMTFEAALALGWIATLGAAVFAWWRARRKYTEIRRDLLHGRIEFRTADGLSYSVAVEDLQPLQYSLKATKDSDGGRVEKYPLGLPFFDPASQVSRTLPLPEQATEAAAQRFAEWLNGALGGKS